VKIGMIEVKKKKGESDERLIRRLRKRVMRSKILLRAKNGRFFHKEPNKRLVKENKLYCLKTKQLMDYLKKIGKATEEN
jgi:ribosomal protein S21